MKKIISGKVYDTATAQEMGSWANTYDTRDFHRVAETLYRKRTGEYFLHGEGGPLTQYARTVGQNEWSGGERIMPLSLAEAKAWAEEHLGGDEYEQIFGIPDEDAGSVQLAIYVAADVAALTRERAAAEKVSLSAYIENALREKIQKGAKTVKKIFIARVADDNSDAYRAFFDREAAEACARDYAAHLTEREKATHTVTLEGYRVEIADDDPRSAEVIWRDMLNDDAPETYDPEIYQEYK